jgi:hypothetical protein
MAGRITDVMHMVRRNKLVGMWAAERLALVGDNAKAYSDEFAKAAFDVQRNNILATIRRDFDAAGVVQTDDDIRAVMSRCWVEAVKRTRASDGSDGALLQIANG